VKIVLDECLPIRLRLEFPEHECVTVQYLQAKGTFDGPLLQKIASAFDVLITIDGNMQYQQNFRKYPQFSVISLSAENNSMKRLLPLVPAIRTALRTIQPGQHIRIP